MAARKSNKKRAKSKARTGKKKPAAKKKTTRKVAPRSSRQKTKKRGTPRTYARRTSAGSGAQSGDLQGISRRERADSESVDELLEEGNAFEAGVVSGVEEADDSDTREVHTHEVPEDDVPEEYLDKDQ